MTGIIAIVVNDEEADRYIARRRLSKAGCFGELLEAASGKAFLDMFFARDWQGSSVLVLMDINMPGISGFETLERLQEGLVPGRVPDKLVVMMLTSSNSPDDRERAASLGIVDGYVTSPAKKEDVEHMRSFFRTGPGDADAVGAFRE